MRSLLTPGRLTDESRRPYTDPQHIEPDFRREKSQLLKHLAQPERGQVGSHNAPQSRSEAMVGSHDSASADPTTVDILYKTSEQLSSFAFMRSLASESDVVDLDQQTTLKHLHLQGQANHSLDHTSPSASDGTSYQALPLQASPPTSLVDIHDVLPPDMSAFEYAITPYLTDQRLPIGYFALSFPSLTPSPSVPSHREQDLTPKDHWSTQNEQPYTPPAPDSGTPKYVEFQSTEHVSRYIHLLHILIRCKVLAQSHVDIKHNVNRTPLQNYAKIREITGHSAQRMANSPGFDAYLAVFWYWKGRGEAGLEEWDAAISAFDEAIRLGLPRTLDRDTKGEGTDVVFWLESVKEEKRRASAERSMIWTLAEELENYFTAIENHDDKEKERIEERLPPSWIPEGQVHGKDNGDFTEREWDYITQMPRSVRHAEEKMEDTFEKHCWRIAQRRQNEWVELYEKLSLGPNERSGPEKHNSR